MTIAVFQGVSARRVTTFLAELASFGQSAFIPFRSHQELPLKCTKFLFTECTGLAGTTDFFANYHAAVYLLISAQLRSCISTRWSGRWCRTHALLLMYMMSCHHHVHDELTDEATRISCTKLVNEASSVLCDSMALKPGWTCIGSINDNRFLTNDDNNSMHTVMQTLATSSINMGYTCVWVRSMDELTYTASDSQGSIRVSSACQHWWSLQPPWNQDHDSSDSMNTTATKKAMHKVVMINTPGFSAFAEYVCGIATALC